MTCKRCGAGNYATVIVSELTFGHGDSTTQTFARCRECKAETEKIIEWGFPATVIAIRQAQDDFYTGKLKD